MSTPPPNSLYPALLAAQRVMGKVVKNATNPHLKSKYADLGSVLDTIEQPLWDNGLIVVQKFWAGDNVLMLTTQIIHAATGDSLHSDVPIISKDPTDPQKIGAAITYYRRYSLLALLGLAPEDDDGHAASQPVAPARGNYGVVAYEPANPPARQRADPSPLPPNDRPAAVAAAAGLPSLDTDEAGTYTVVSDALGKILDEAWQKAEDGKTLDDIRNYLNAMRHGMTKDERQQVVKTLAKIEKKWYAPAGMAG